MTYFSGMGLTGYFDSNLFISGSAGFVYSWFEAPNIDYTADYEDEADILEASFGTDPHDAWGGGVEVQFGKEWWTDSQTAKGAIATNLECEQTSSRQRTSAVFCGK